MSLLYFNGAVDTSWNTIGNWWFDSVYSSAAGRLPANGDTVYLDSEIDTGPAIAVTLTAVNVGTLNVSYFGVTLSGTHQAVGSAFFNSSSYNSGTVSGDATFNDYSSNYYGTVSGDATFNSSSYNNSGTVSGDATFNDSSNNYGTVSGDATFNDSSYNNSGTVSGDATFNDSSYNYGTVSGDATFNDYSSNNYGTVSGDATFNDSSYNYYGTVSGVSVFSFSSISTQVNAYGGSLGSIKIPSGLNGSSILGLI
jgi:hypothetical protein